MQSKSQISSISRNQDGPLVRDGLSSPQRRWCVDVRGMVKSPKSPCGDAARRRQGSEQRESG